MTQEIQELFKHYLSHLPQLQAKSNRVNTNTEGTIQSVCINGVSALTL